MDLLDKVIVITGAARGLGAAIARQIAAKGGKLALVDLEEKDLKATQSKCEELGAGLSGHIVTFWADNL